MGMIVTLYLISANVYNSVEAPNNRGFSYIEIWMIGSQIPILFALFEYGFILYLKKIAKKSDNCLNVLNFNEAKSDMDEKIKKLDFAAMIFSFFYLVSFASGYWMIAFM